MFVFCREHHRERERDSKKRQIRRDNERKFKEKLSDWLRREEDKVEKIKKIVNFISILFLNNIND